MTEKRESVPYVFLAALALVSLFAFYLYMARLHPLVAFMDSLRFLTYYAASEEGRQSIFATWAQGDHHGYFPQVFVYLNAKLLGYRVYGFTLLSGVVIAATALLLCGRQYATLPAENKREHAIRAGLAVVTFAGMFSLSNWELYSLDIGVTAFAKNLIFVLYWLGIEHAIRNDSQRLTICLILSGPLIVLTIAFGWCYPFVLATVPCMYLAFGFGRIQNRVAASLLIALALYILGGRLFHSDLPEYRAGETGTLLNAVIAFCYALGSAFVSADALLALRIPTSTYVYLASGMLLLSCAILVTKVRWRTRSLFPCILIVYGLLDALAISWARGQFGPELASASRYYLDLSMIPISLIWLALASEIRKDGNASQNVAGLSLAGVIVIAFLAGQVISSRIEWKTAPYRHEAFIQMKTILRDGVQTTGDATLLQQPFDVAKRAVEIQRKYHLGPFRTEN
jgi:hypothetical protein